MFIGLLLLGVAAAVLWLGAELFVEHASAAGRFLGTTGLAVGVLLAGAEPEELLTAVAAALRDRGGIAAGDAIGANVTMLTLVLGLAAIARPLPVGGRVRRYLIGATVLGGVAALVIPGGIDRSEGSALVALYVAAVAVVWIRERRIPAIGELTELDDDESDDESGGAGGLALVVVGIAAMAGGGWIAVLGAERLVEAFGVIDSVVGLSLVALATTAELVALVVAAHRRGVGELAVAGVIGSAGYNATMTLGGAALARPIVTTGVGTAAWLAAALPLALIVLGGTAGKVRRLGGTVLLVLYLAYLIVLYG